MDKNSQRRVWNRVYSSLPRPRPQPRSQLQNARMRAMQSLRFYDSRKEDPIYGPAYEHLAELVRQELAMLQRIQ